MPHAEFWVTTHHRPYLLSAALSCLTRQTVPAGWTCTIRVAGTAADEGRGVALGVPSAEWVPVDDSRVTVKLNRLLQTSIADLACLADDDDLQPPDRLGAAIAAFESGADWSGCGSVRFCDLVAGAAVTEWTGIARQGLIGTSLSFRVDLLRRAAGWPEVAKGKDGPMARKLRDLGARFEDVTAAMGPIVCLQHGNNIWRRPTVAKGGRTRRGSFMLRGLGALDDVPQADALRLVQMPAAALVAPYHRLLSVVMSARGSALYVREAVQSVLDQELPPGWGLELLVGVDADPDVLAALATLDDPRAGVVEMTAPSGTYVTTNTLLGLAQGELLTRCDSDDVMLPGRLCRMVQTMDEEPGLDLVNTWFQTVHADLSPAPTELEGPAMGVWMYRRSALDALGGYRPWSCGADMDLLVRARALEHRERVIPERLYLYRQHSGQLTRARGTRGGSDARRAYWSRIQADEARYERGDVPERVIPVVGAHTVLDRGLFRRQVTASLASIPGRKAALRKVVAALLPQVDRLHVYLNGYDDVPDCLLHPRVQVARSQDHGDLGDAGKMFWSGLTRGYILTCDDDILYPADYVRQLTAAIDRYGRAAVVTYHGSRVREPFTDWWTDRDTFRFGAELADDQVVHAVGTGVAGWYAGAVRVSREDFKAPNMADTWMSGLCQIQRVPVVTAAHGAGWLRDMGCYVGSIFRAGRYGLKGDNRAKQNAVWASHCPWALHQPAPAGAYVEAGYWQQNYARGIGSGYGSRGAEAAWKVEQIVADLRTHGCSSWLDLGSGDGELAFAVRDLVAVEYQGVDLSQTACGLNQERAARDGVDGMRWQVGDLTVDPLPAADLVTCFDVLFHLSTDEKHAAAVAAISRSFRRVALVVAWNDGIMDVYRGRFAAHTFYRPLRPHLPPDVLCEELPVPNWGHCKSLYRLTRAASLL